MKVDMRKTKSPDNEGKCCDAVVRFFEEMEGCTRTDLRFPEHEKHPTPFELAEPVDLVCIIGKTRYAIEHTKLQSYPKQIHDGVHFSNALHELELQLWGQLPKFGWFMLVVPAKAFDGVKINKVQRIKDIIVAWVVRAAPTMTLSTSGYAGLTETLNGVPFDVSLYAIAGSLGSLGELKIARYAPPDVDAQRLDEMGKTLTKKLPELKAWSEKGFNTVLVLEVEDISLANHGKALEGLKHHLPWQGCFPDYIFFVYAIGSPWIIQTLVVNRSFPTDIFEWPSYRQFNPEELNDICANTKTGDRC